MKYWPHGISSTEGDTLLTEDNLYTDARVFYVRFSDGDDASDGRSRVAPMKTLGAAVTSAAAGDIIVLLEGHDETVTATITINKRLCVVAEGRDDDGKPTVRIRNGTTSGGLIVLDAASIQLRNFIIEKPLTPRAASELAADTASGLWLKGMRFELGSTSQGPTLRLISSAWSLIEDCEWVLLEDASSASSDGAAVIAGLCAGIRMWRCTFDGGDSFLWPHLIFGGVVVHGAAYAESDQNTIEFEQLSLLNGPFFLMDNGTTGYVQCDEMTGGARVDWGTAPVHSHPNGLGCNSGPPVITNPNLFTTGDVFYVHSGTGDANNDGLSKGSPWADLAGEVGNLSAGDIVVFLDGHEEPTITATIIVNERWYMTGEGSSGGLPTVKFHMDSIGTDAFNFVVGGFGASLRNVQIVPPGTGNQGRGCELIACQGVLLEDLYHPADGSSDFPCVFIDDSDFAHLRGCRFTVVSDQGDSPGDASVVVASTITDLKMLGCIYDGGFASWTTGYGYREKAAVTGLFAEQTSLLIGGSMALHVSTSGWAQAPVATGESRVDWTVV